MKKCHIGSLPPPLGGISVYLYRLQQLHPQDRFVNARKLRTITYMRLLCQNKEEIVLHGYNFKKVVLAYILSLFSGVHYSLVLHGEEDLFQRKSFLVRFLLRKSFEKMSTIQLVNQEFYAKMRLIFQEKVMTKTFVQHAFLPPPLGDEELIYRTYSSEMLSFLDRHSPILVANAYRLVFWHGNIDLYGVDMCIDLLHRLKEKYPHIGLVFALADDSGEPEYFERIKNCIQEYNLNDNVFFMTGQRELWPLFRRADLMLRPTCTDGDALSIREALFFHTPTLASDIVERPEGTVVFKNRDGDDLYEKAYTMLSRYEFSAT